MQQSKREMLKVLCPVDTKHGKTYWIRIGNAFRNRDGSTNVYLNAYPTSGKLQIRALDDQHRDSEEHSSAARMPPTDALPPTPNEGLRY